MRLLRYIRKDKFNDVDFFTAMAATYCFSNGNWLGAVAWFDIQIVLNVILALILNHDRGTPT